MGGIRAETIRNLPNKGMYLIRVFPQEQSESLLSVISWFPWVGYDVLLGLRCQSGCCEGSFEMWLTL